MDNFIRFNKHNQKKTKRIISDNSRDNSSGSEDERKLKAKFAVLIDGSFVEGTEKFAGFDVSKPHLS